MHHKTYLRNKKAYTLIEFMVAISIMTIMTLMTYVPYNFYNNKEKVRIAAKEISQTLGEARNMAINGLTNSNSNIQIGIYFDKEAGNKIKYLSYPYDFTGSYSIIPNVEKNIKLIQEKSLPELVNITSLNDKTNMLFIYKSITGDLEIKVNNNGTFSNYTATGVDINFGFNGNTNGTLSKIVKYNTNTFITDY